MAALYVAHCLSRPHLADIAAFGGCIELASRLVALGASVGLPNKDGFTALDSMQPSGVEGKSLQASHSIYLRISSEQLHSL